MITKLSSSALSSISPAEHTCINVSDTINYGTLFAPGAFLTAKLPCPRLKPEFVTISSIILTATFKKIITLPLQVVLIKIGMNGSNVDSIVRPSLLH